MVSDFKSPIGVGRSPATDKIVEDVVATVIDITVAAWPRAVESGKVKPSDQENDITDQLRWEMVGEKNRRTPRPQLRFERETQRDDSNKQHPTGRIDVYVIYTFDEAEYFAIECKKVTARSHKRANYYVKNGVCRFSSGKYGPGHPYGAMLGFVSNGTPEATAEFMGDKILNFDVERTRISTRWGWRAESSFGSQPHLYSTKHRQEGICNSILLLHLFLPFDSGKEPGKEGQSDEECCEKEL